jgi:hypothetical protein
VRRIPAKTVVLVSFNQPNRDLAEQLATRFSNVKIHLVGDVRGRNSMMTAIHEAAEVARAI